MAVKVVSEREILELKKAAQEGKDTYIKAESTFEEVKRNIENISEELKALGVDPEKSEEHLDNMAKEINELYAKGLSKLPSKQ